MSETIVESAYRLLRSVPNEVDFLCLGSGSVPFASVGIDRGNNHIKKDSGLARRPKVS